MAEKRNLLSRLRSFRWKPFLYCLGVSLIYPLVVLVTSDKKLLKLIDALTISGLIFLALGVVYSFISHGDFDIMEYVSRRSADPETMKPFKAFQEDKKEKRKDSMNYPLLTGFLLLLVAGILTVCFY